MIRTFDDILSHLRFGKPFVFQRFGDGEWACLLGHKGENCDGSKYYKDLGIRLRDVILRNPPYDLALQPKAGKDMGWEINTFLKHNNIKREWPNADLLHDASTKGRLGGFKKVLQNKKVTIVGAPHVHAWLPEARSVVTPPRNCWLNYNSILGECCEHANDGRKVFLFACSLMAGVLIDDLYHMYEGLTLIDIGSVLSPYCGVVNRRYHQKILDREVGK